MKKFSKIIEANSVIAKDSIVEGTYKTSGSARIDGNMIGDVFAEHTIVIGQKGSVTGNVHALSIIVAGEINGQLHATQKVEVASTGSVKGDIHTPSIVIDENASFEGNCHMNKSVKKVALNLEIDDDLE